MGDGGVSPTMNVFENQTSTRATVVIVKCYENHATDARVKRIEAAPTGGGYAERMLREPQSADTMETERTTYSIGGGRCTTHCQR